MQQYIFTLNENQAALSFLEFVRNLNFVLKVEPVKQTQPAIVEARIEIPLPKAKGDFSEIFGLWKNTDISLETIRKKAWPKRV